MDIKSDANNLHITLTLPLRMRGAYTYGEGEWEKPALCVHIDEHLQEFGLFHTQYLDYKDSLQATSPIVFFSSIEEARKAAEFFNLPVEYAPDPTLKVKENNYE